MSDKQAEVGKYTIHIERAEGIAIGDGAQVIGREKDRSPIGVPFQVPPLPAHFVPRPEVSEVLKFRLLTDEGTIPGALAVGAVHGLGGIGKTTLVSALAHDPDLQTRFPGGILWVTLGQQPEVLSLLVGWIQALQDYTFRPTVVESATAHLRTLLHDKACLLVVDDAWQADHVRPFLVGGERCQVLVTTRDAMLARKVGARLYDLDVMTETQALALFQARLGPLDDNHKQAAALAHELGYLPLALELVAAQIEGGCSWDELLEVFHRKLSDLATLDLDEATYRNESLRLSFRLSLERLSSEDQEAFAWLGVLPEDAHLNPAMAATLWGQSEADARKRLRLLRNKSLIRAVVEEQHTLHDLLHDEARLRLAEQISLPEAHAALLTRYQAHTQGGLWYTLPNDGYIHEHLTWHMEQAGQIETVHTLLAEETAEGRNGWYEARERLGQLAGFLADVEKAWQLVDESISRQGISFSISLQTHYALIVTSLNSLAGNVPPELLVALVDKGAWSPAQGLAYACQTPNGWQRARALAGLAPHLPLRLKKKALSVASQLEHAHFRANALAMLSAHLPESSQAEVMAQAIQEARSVGDKSAQVWALAGLSPFLPHILKIDTLASALTALCKTGEDWLFADGLFALAPHMPPELVLEALRIARNLKEEGARVRALAGLIPHLPQMVKTEAITEALAITQGFDREDQVRAWTELVPALPEPMKTEVIANALAMSQHIKHHSDQAWALARLAPCVAESGHPEESLAMVRAIGNKYAQTEALAALLPYLPEPLKSEAISEALVILQEIELHPSQSTILALLAPYLSAELATKALMITWRIGDEDVQARTLAALVCHTPEVFRARALSAMIARVQRIKIEQLRPEILIYLAPCVPTESMSEVVTAAQKIKGDRARIRTLVGLIPYLSESARSEVSRVVQSEMENIGIKGISVHTLIDLFRWLPEPLHADLWGEALAMVWEIQQDAEWLEGLVELTPHLPQPAAGETLREALAVVKELDDELSRARALGKLAPLLSFQLLAEALAFAREIVNKDARAVALAGLAPSLLEPARSELMQEALTAIRRIEDEKTRVEGLVELIPHLSEAQRTQELLSVLFSVLQIESLGTRVRFLTKLAPNLADLAPNILRDLWKQALHILARRPRRSLLADLGALVPVILSLDDGEAATEVFCAIEDAGRWWK